MLENPVLVYWVSQNIVWDRLDEHERLDGYVEKLAGYINPIGMKKIFESRSGATVYREGPKTKSELGLSDETWAKIEASPNRPLILNRSSEVDDVDDIIPGGLDG